MITILSDFDIITHQFPDRQTIRVYPISDVHLGAAEHKEKEWEEFCKRILSEDNSYVILGGDLINNATRCSVSNVFEERMRPREQKKLMTEMLKPLANRILCMVSGNHERRSGKDADDDPSYDIACKLDVEDRYRENIAFLRIQMGDQSMNGLTNPTYVLVVTHGAGGGMLTGGAVNRGERFGYVLDGCDALIIGHTHKPYITQPAKLAIDARNNKVSIKPFKVICSTSWLDWGGYAAQKMLSPSSFAPQVITLQGKRKEIRVEM